MAIPIPSLNGGKSLGDTGITVSTVFGSPVTSSAIKTGAVAAVAMIVLLVVFLGRKKG